MEYKYPSGKWRGFWTYAGERNRHGMSLRLEFEKGRIEGQGEDEVGGFLILGNMDEVSGRCSFTKGYVDKHAVEYSGEYAAGGLVGFWNIGSTRGGFALWPGECGDVPAALDPLVPHVRGVPRAVQMALTWVVLLVLLALIVLRVIRMFR